MPTLNDRIAACENALTDILSAGSLLFEELRSLKNQVQREQNAALRPPPWAPELVRESASHV